MNASMHAGCGALRHSCHDYAAAAAKGKPSLKAAFLEGDMDEAVYATTALDDDFDFM